MPLLGAESCSPAVLPQDVENHFFSSYRPPVTSPGLPGCFVPPVVPEEVIQRVLNDYKKDSSRAADAAKLEAELQARVAYASDPSMYHPWTADRLCTPCSLLRAGPWSYHGTQAIKDEKDHDQYVLTCGMLKDTGVISDRAGCEAAEANVVAQYNQFVIERERSAKKDAAKAQIMGYVRLAFEVIVTVVATVVTGPGGAAVASAFYALEHMAEGFVVSGGEIDPKATLKQIGKIAVSLVPVVGPTAGAVIQGIYEVATLANDFYEYTQSSAEAKKANEEAESRVQAQMSALADLVKARASLDELAAATRMAKAELEVALDEKRASDQKKWIIGGVAAAFAAFFFLRRR